MEQMDVLEIQSGFEDRCCLADLPVVQDQVDTEVDPNVFTLVVETNNYRIEIEIG